MESRSDGSSGGIDMHMLPLLLPGVVLPVALGGLNSVF